MQRVFLYFGHRKGKRWSENNMGMHALVKIAMDWYGWPVSYNVMCKSSDSSRYLHFPDCPRPPR